MKKVCCVLLSFSLVLMLVACGGKPSDLDDNIYKDAVALIKQVDKYLEGDLTLDELDEKLDDFYGEVGEDGTNGDVLCDIEILKMTVSRCALSKSIAENSPSPKEDTEDYRSEIREDRDELAEDINYKE